MQSFYDILGVSEKVSQEEISQAYDGLSQQYHPDTCQDPDAQQKMQKIKKAYKILGDSSQRAEYDLYLRFVPKRNMGISQIKQNEEISFEFILDRVLEVYAYVYPPDSYDVILSEFNRESVSAHAQKMEWNKTAVKNAVEYYRYHWIILVTTFLGLPNYFELGEDPTWPKIVEKFFGLEDNKTLGRNIINVLLSPFVGIKNLVSAIFTTTRNIFKLLTEFLPALAAVLGAILIDHVFNNAFVKMKDEDNQIKAQGWAMMFLMALPLFIVTYVCAVAAYLGRAITSPVDNIRLSWKVGLNEEKISYGSQYPWGPQIGGYLNAFMCAFGSALITVTFYGLLFPLFVSAIPALGPQITALAAHIASSIPQLAAFVTYVAENLSVLGMLIACGMSTVGVLIDRLVEWVKHEWYTSCYEDEKKLIPLPLEWNELPHHGDDDQNRPLLYRPLSRLLNRPQHRPQNQPVRVTFHVGDRELQGAEVVGLLQNNPIRILPFAPQQQPNNHPFHAQQQVVGNNAPVQANRNNPNPQNT